MNKDDSIKRYHLTFDVDWAPDFAVSDILSLLDVHDVQATFFITHESDVLKDIAAAGHNIGIHPNFFDGSDQGRTVEQIVDFLLGLAPSADMMRTHGLFQSSALFYQIIKAFPQLTLDVSAFMQDFPLIQKFKWCFQDIEFERLNYNWEDDVAFSDTNIDWQTCKLEHPITILDFHPIHLALNASNLDHYGQLKSKLEGRKLFTATHSDVNPCKNTQWGCQDYLVSLLKSHYEPIDIRDIK